MRAQSGSRNAILIAETVTLGESVAMPTVDDEKWYPTTGHDPLSKRAGWPKKNSAVLVQTVES
jgi:hypothetical protein